MRRPPPLPTPPKYMPGFGEFFSNEIEAKIRIPRRNVKADARAIWVTWAALGATAITTLLAVFGVPSNIIGLAAVVSGALIVGSVQLRMAGTSMGVRETRDFVVSKMAEFLNLDYQLAPPNQALDELLDQAGRVSHTAITRGADMISGRVGECKVTSMQLLGGAGPSRDDEGDEPASWFGIPVAELWEQLTIDGLLARVELRHALPANFTITCDQRIVNPPDSSNSLRFAPAVTGDQYFDAEFFALDAFTPQITTLLHAELRGYLLHCKNTIGPCTLYVRGHVAYLSAWFVGDIYEISSMGFALPKQSHQIAESMQLLHEFAAAMQRISPDVRPDAS
jgi:hypothetical protein